MTTICLSGWQPDLPDPRDYTPRHEQIEPLLRDLPARGERPSHVDWRTTCTPCPEDFSALERAGSVHVCLDLVEQNEYRVHGRQLRLSRPFLYRTTHRLASSQRLPPLSLRAVWQAVVQFGVPELDVWPGCDGSWEEDPDAFAYGGARDYSALRYVRLDPRSHTGPETLDLVRAFLSAGFLCAFGIPLCTSAEQNGEIGYPTIFDDVRGGQALIAVGYDDHHRLRSDRGCLIVRGCWGRSWGDEGYGWLPYTYVREKLATDFWAVFDPQWLRSGEFKQPS